MNESPLQAFTDSFTALLAQAVAYLPRVLAAVAVLVAGWLVAKGLRALSVRLVHGLDRLWHRLVLRARVEQLQRRHPPTHVVGELVFWLVLLFFLTGATQVLGLTVFTSWLAQVAGYIPVLLAGLLIILAGFVVSSLARDVVTATAASAGLAHGDLLGRLAQALILLAAGMVGADQVGIDVGFLTLLFGVALGALLGGLALAFGLGARDHVANLLSARQARRLYRVGDHLRMAGAEGRILELGPTTLVLETRDGRAVVPARLLSEQVTYQAAEGEGADETG